MKKTDIKTGAILEIPLEKGYGYGYVKLIFSKDIQPDLIHFPIIKVYNLFRNQRLNKDEFNSIFFETDKLVMFPLLMLGFPIFRSKFKWDIKGYAELTEEDEVIPDYLNIEIGKEFSQSTIKVETESENGCLLIRNFQVVPTPVRDFELIKHVGQFFPYSPKGIKKMISMYWMNQNGEAIKNYYTDEEFNTNGLNKLIHNNIMINNNIEFLKSKKNRRLKSK